MKSMTVSKLTVISLVLGFTFFAKLNTAQQKDYQGEKQDRLKVLKEYQKFESFVNEKITSIFQNLDLDEQSCSEENKDKRGACRKTTTALLSESNITSVSTNIDNVNGILLALIPRKCFIFFLNCATNNVNNYCINISSSTRTVGVRRKVSKRATPKYHRNAKKFRNSSLQFQR